MNSYRTLAKTLLETSGAREGARVTGLDTFMLAADTASLRQADSVLFAELKRRPGDPGLHEQAALLWAAHALRQSQGPRQDPRAFMNGIVAHLAIASALGPARSIGPEGELATIALHVLLNRQTTAMAALSRIEAAKPSKERAAWVRALQVRVTRDPRTIALEPAPTRLEQLESLVAFRRSRNCGAALERARAWGMRPSADVRESLWCLDEYEGFAGDPLQLQVADAAVLAGQGGPAQKHDGFPQASLGHGYPPTLLAACRCVRRSASGRCLEERCRRVRAAHLVSEWDG